MKEYIPYPFKEEFEKGSIDLKYLILNGFKQTSRKYMTISKQWKAYRKYYEVRIELSESQFKDFLEEEDRQEAIARFKP